jgi:hypothetical protein
VEPTYLLQLNYFNKKYYKWIIFNRRQLLLEKSIIREMISLIYFWISNSFGNICSEELPYFDRNLTIIFVFFPCSMDWRGNVSLFLFCSLFSSTVQGKRSQKISVRARDRKTRLWIMSKWWRKHGKIFVLFIVFDYSLPEKWLNKF